jgi:hypothetical protein
MMCLWVSSKEKKYKTGYFYFLKVTEERSRIRSWIRIRTRIWIHLSDVRIRGSGSATKCHGPPTLDFFLLDKLIFVSYTGMPLGF